MPENPAEVFLQVVEKNNMLNAFLHVFIQHTQSRGHHSFILQTIFQVWPLLDCNISNIWTQN